MLVFLVQKLGWWIAREKIRHHLLNLHEIAGYILFYLLNVAHICLKLC